MAMLKSRSKLVFKSAAAMLVIVCGCARQSQPPPRAVTKSEQFVYEQRVGVASIRGDENGCLAVYNPTLVPGVPVTLVDQPDVTQLAEPATVKEATVVERLSQSCDNHMGTGAGDRFAPSFYQIRLVTKPWPFYTSVVAIINHDRPITVRAGKIDADFDGDGTNESLRTCSSSEGVHHQIWTGAPLQGRPRWHWYVYAGYDTNPTCTEQEYFGPK
jgi:hypothetical protein